MSRGPVALNLRATVVLVGALIGSVVAGAQTVLRDPTQPPAGLAGPAVEAAEREGQEGAVPALPSAPVVPAVQILKKSPSLAQGQARPPSRVVTVIENEVTVQSGQRSHTLPAPPAVVKKWIPSRTDRSGDGVVKP